MKKVLFRKGIAIESDTCYYFDKDLLEYYEEDTDFSDNYEYFCSLSEHSKGYGVAVCVESKENVTLDFGGATILLHGMIQPFVIANSKNVAVKNVNVRYDRSFTTEMILKERGENYLRCRVKDGFPYEVKDGRFIPYSPYFRDETIDKGFVFMQEFDTETLKGLSWPVVIIGSLDKEKAVLPWGGTVPMLLAYEDGEDVVFKGENLPGYKVGSTLVISGGNREISNLTAFNSEDVRIENYRILNGLGMGILPIYCKNVTLDGLKMFYDEKSPGIASNTADGLHAVALKGDLVIKNSVFYGMIDDALNIHSNYYAFESKNGREMYITCPGPAVTFKIFGEGDTISVKDGHTMYEKARYKILKIETVDTRTKKLTLDKEALDHAPGDLIENLDTNPNVYIENCSFGKANTHLRFQTRGKTVMKNCFTEMDLLFTGDTNYWFEASPVNDVTFENVRFETERVGVASIPEFKSCENEKYYHKNVKIVNCSFSTPNAIYARFTDNIELTDCKNDRNAPFEVTLDNCGSFMTNCEVNEHVTSNRSEKDE